LRAAEPWLAPAELSEAPHHNDIRAWRGKEVLLPSKKRPTPQEIPMRKTILSVLGATLVAATLMQTAVATERRHATKAGRAPVSTGQQFRNAKNQVVPSLAEQDYEYWHGVGLAAAGPSALRFPGN
jgi:hypothetical protein